ncbi:MAG: hypothetical protein ACT6FD_01560 [Methanosarcinaceae archaeon]
MKLSPRPLKAQNAGRALIGTRRLHANTQKISDWIYKMDRI